MKFSTLFLASVLSLVAASPVEQRGNKLTTQTNVYTGIEVYDTIVSESPYWSTGTSTYLWTQTVTLAVPTP